MVLTFVNFKPDFIHGILFHILSKIVDMFTVFC